jgi:glycerophosphoryl diester phosphodiesterase
MNNFPYKMKYLLLFLAVLWNGFCCIAQTEGKNTAVENSHIETLVQNLKNSKSNQVIVVAHRGDWRNAPENSLRGIQNCIDMGVDMVEIDIQRTKDGELVLMHDKKINRTTTGKGRVEEYTLKQLKSFYLLDAEGRRTQEKIPTLEEALLLARDKILINLDKSYRYYEACYVIIENTRTQEQVLIKGKKTVAEVEKKRRSHSGKGFFMPVIRLSDPEAETMVSDYMKHQIPIAFEFSVPDDTVALVDDFKEIRSKGASIWVNAIRAKNNAGNDDEKALGDPKVYDWFIDNHVNIIQTDNPQLLLDYLRARGLHR